ncbi:nucleoid-associated protein [Micromonospora orduensis]|uniref:nucleoid-associated protein n=1 Tax=Micromonospora orduensis TaxID=1420891 RepID=UPI00142F1F96|nr:nucleoid-associated protein [Micromonospora orduensis]
MILRNSICNLEPPAQAELESRLRLVLKESGRQIVEDIEAPSKTPAIIRGYLEDSTADFVSMSQELAQVLRDSQSGANSAGILLVADCDTGSSRSVLLVKIEQEGGMRAEESVDKTAGQDVKYFSDLFLTSRSKVYKVALFRAVDVDESLLYGWAADRQMTGGGLAVFFLRKYLGCQHLDEPKEVTRRFYQHSQNWVNTRVSNAETRTRYAMAIASELLSERRTVSPQAFAVNHLKSNHRDDYLTYLENEGLPRATFDKDVSLIESKLSQFSLTFDSGLTLTGPRSTLEEGDIVQFQSLDGPVDRVIITDKVGPIKGRGVPGRSAHKPNSSDQ